MLFFAALFTVFASSFAGNFTVTEEVWFDIEIKDYEGPGEHYKGMEFLFDFFQYMPTMFCSLQCNRTTQSFTDWSLRRR